MDLTVLHIAWHPWEKSLRLLAPTSIGSFRKDWFLRLFQFHTSGIGFCTVGLVWRWFLGKDLVVEAPWFQANLWLIHLPQPFYRFFSHFMFACLLLVACLPVWCRSRFIVFSICTCNVSCEWLWWFGSVRCRSLFFSGFTPRRSDCTCFVALVAAFTC